MISLFLKLSRPYQWTKNGFVLIGVLFSGEASFSQWVEAGAAFFLFCGISSAIYAFNDCKDYESDREDPLRKHRPVASGKITVQGAFGFSVLLSLIVLCLAFLVSPKLVVVLFSYLVLGLSYSLYLKKTVLLDVFCIAFGFMLRVLAGTYALGITPSSWLIMCALMISLFIGFSKRYARLRSKNTEPEDSSYEQFLRLMLGVSVSSTILSYGLYTISPRTIEVHGTDSLIYTLPIVIFGLFRYLYLVIVKKKGDDPSKDIFIDKQILLALLTYGIALAVIR